MNNDSDAALILVMGAAGTGKTEFIKLLTQDEGVEVGYSLEPGAGELALSKFFLKERCVEFVECPGFDDSRKSLTDADIFKTIAAFLDSASKPGNNLHGVIFMHRISDPGVDNLTKHNIKMLLKICGPDSLKNVVIVTTMWDFVSDKIATVREEALTSDGSFKPLLDSGAQLLRHDDDFASAYTITKKLLGMPPVRLLIQRELDDGKSIPDTTAGSELSLTIQNLIASHQKEIRKVRDELTAAIEANNQAAKRELELERKTLAKYLKDFEVDRRKLDESLASVRAKAEAKRKATEMESERQRADFLQKLLQDAMGNKKLDATVERWRKDRETTRLLLEEEKVLRELFLATGEQWSIINVSDGVYKVVSAGDRPSGLDKSSPSFWLIDSRNNDFELKEKGSGDVLRFQANNYTKTGRVQKPSQPMPFDQFTNRPISTWGGGYYDQRQQFNQPNPTQIPSTLKGNEPNGRLKPGKYNIRNRVTLNLLCIYENNSLPEAKLQIWGKGLYGYPAAYEFMISEEKNGLFSITSTFYNQSTPRYLVDKGGAMMNITKAGRVRLIHAGMDFYYIVVDVDKNMVLKDPNAQNQSNGYSMVDELDETDRRQLWEFLAVA